MTEILRPEQYEEYEAFCQNHPRGGFTQSTRWFQVKNNWKGEVVVVRDAAGKIRAGCAVLVQKLPVIGAAALLYAPRGGLRSGKPPAAERTQKAGWISWQNNITLISSNGIRKFWPQTSRWLQTMKEMGFSLFCRGRKVLRPFRLGSITICF